MGKEVKLRELQICEDSEGQKVSGGHDFFKFIKFIIYGVPTVCVPGTMLGRGVKIGK